MEAVRRDFVANVGARAQDPGRRDGLLAEAVLDAADDPDEVRQFATRMLHESTGSARWSPS